MGKRVATTRTRTASRTFWQALIPALITLGLVLPEAINLFLSEAGEVMPEGLRLWLLAAAAAIAAVSAGLAKVMAIPSVNAWLKRLGLANDDINTNDQKGA